MIVTLEQTKKIAATACIALDDDELHVMRKALENIVNWIDVSCVDIESAFPLINPNESYLEFLPDVAEIATPQSAILKNAPKSRYGYFVVPKVIE